MKRKQLQWITNSENIVKPFCLTFTLKPKQTKRSRKNY